MFLVFSLKPWKTQLKELIFRSSRPVVFFEKVFLEISQNSQKNTCARAFFNKVAGLRCVTLLIKRLWHRCVQVNFVKLLRTSFVKLLRTALSHCFFMSFDSANKVFPGSQVGLCSSYFGFSWPYSICLFLWFNEQKLIKNLFKYPH